MQKKTKIKNSPSPKSLLEEEIVKIVNRTIKNNSIQLATEDIKIIAREVMPDIDRLIANKVSQHFVEIGEFIANKFSIGE